MNCTAWSTHASFLELKGTGQEKNLFCLSVVDSPDLGFPILYYSLIFYESVQFHGWYDLIILSILILHYFDRAESFMILESIFKVFGLLISHLFCL